jgi:hypothetical protein
MISTTCCDPLKGQVVSAHGEAIEEVGEGALEGAQEGGQGWQEDAVEEAFARVASCVEEAEEARGSAQEVAEW